MTWWTGNMVRMLRELAQIQPNPHHDGWSRFLSGREIAHRINVSFGTWLTGDAVRRQAAVQGIKLHGKSGPPKGNTNSRYANRHRTRNERGRFCKPAAAEAPDCAD